MREVQSACDGPHTAQLTGVHRNLIHGTVQAPWSSARKHIQSHWPSLGLVQVAVCCFDKTGTLTSDDMVLRGLAGVPEKGRELLQDVKAASKDTLRVLAACQSLIQIEGDLVGDPLEKAAFEATGETAIIIPAFAEDTMQGCCLPGLRQKGTTHQHTGVCQSGHFLRFCVGGT